MFQILLLLQNPKGLVIFYDNFSLFFFLFPSCGSWDSFFKGFTAGKGTVFFLKGYIYSWLLVFYSQCFDHQRRPVSNTNSILSSKWPSHKYLSSCLSWLGKIIRGLLHIDVHKQIPTAMLSQSGKGKWIFFDDALLLAMLPSLLRTSCSSFISTAQWRRTFGKTLELGREPSLFTMAFGYWRIFFCDFQTWK